MTDPQERGGATAENRLWSYADLLLEVSKLRAQLATLTDAYAEMQAFALAEQDDGVKLRADLASAREQIAELKADVQRGHEWQRGYADRLIESQAQCDQARAQCERLNTALYEIERMPFGFEAEVHAIALAALDQQAQPDEVHR
jgi:chromosome segregation ATPase